MLSRESPVLKFWTLKKLRLRKDWRLIPYFPSNKTKKRIKNYLKKISLRYHFNQIFKEIN